MSDAPPLPASTPAEREKRPPNIILFMTDQHRADFLGCYGHPLLRTPNIDAIAARGTRFDRCYVAAPVCMPNRASLMTGRMPSVHGVRMNGIPLSFRQTTFVDALRRSGYDTALVGKSHLQTMVDLPPYVRMPEPPPDRIALPPEAREARRFDDGDYGQELPTRWRSAAPLRMSRPYYGFDHVDLCTGHGDLAGGHYYQWLRTHHADPDSLRGPNHALPHDYICPQSWRTAVPEELYPTSYIRDRAIDYLSSAGEDPFFLMVSFPDPHHPFTPPGRYWDLYRPDDVVLPPSFHHAGQRSHHVRRAKTDRRDNPDLAKGYGAFAVSEREAREAVALTCGMIGMIDDAIGAIMQRVGERGDAARTVIIFTSDHGDYLGDHGLLLKGALHYQSLVRVPLIWSDASNGVQGGASGALASSIDIAATILERVGLAAYNGLQGRSLLPGLSGADVRDSVLIEEDGQDKQFGFDRAPRVRTLVTQRHRLTLYDEAGAGELFDLAADPEELDDLWTVSASAAEKHELMEALARAQMDCAERSPMPSFVG